MVNLTVEDDSRYCLRPIKHERLYAMFVEQMQMFWTTKEINFSEDKRMWERLSPNVQRFFGVVLAFFANADNLVLQNLLERFRTEIKLPEAQLFFGIQAGIESVHIDVYNECINTVISDERDKKMLFEAIKNDPIVQPKTNWMKQYITSDAHIKQRIFAWIISEGLFFSASFAALLWARKQNMLSGICFANEKISEDEGLHVRFGVQLFLESDGDMKSDVLHEMMREAVKLEQQFAEDSLKVDLLGINGKQMKLYIQHMADVLLIMIGQEPIYHVPNPFDWMVSLTIIGKSNFFEKRVSEYTKHSDESRFQKGHLSKLGEEIDF